MSSDYSPLFSDVILKKIFPEQKADQFFDAMFGDTTEGAYDISLKFKGCEKNQIIFEFHLIKREERCLTCQLTYGLPQVFTRHPIINVKGLVKDINNILGDKAECGEWKLGSTQAVSGSLHIIPLVVWLK